MAIQISGCTVIDNDRNITNANNMCVGVVTMTGSSGDIETPGTITAGGIGFPPSVVFFVPADGATDVALNANIVIVFDQVIEKATTGIGTTANITLRDGSAEGTVLQTIGVASTSVQVDASVVTIVPSLLPLSTNVYVVIDAGAFNTSAGDSELIDTYDFTTRDLEPGDSFGGGFLICRAASVYWIVSPNTSEVSRNWYSINDANTRAQQVSGCTGWFVPTVSQLQNPGYFCRTFWDSFSSTVYWSSTNINSTTAWLVSMSTGFAFGNPYHGPYATKTSTYCVRAFRCVTY